MFSATTQPLSFSEACLQSLCASLNAPIVRMDELPAGPARAAVVVYAEQYGDLGMAVAVRSLEGGEVVVMRCQESLPPDADPQKALETALSFGEGLGFVFDQDMLVGHPSHETRVSALGHWQQLVGSDEAFSPADVASPPAPEGVANPPDPERLPEMEDLLSAAASESDEAPPVELVLEEISLSGVEEAELEVEGDELLLDEIAPLEVEAADAVDARLEIDADDAVDTRLEIDAPDAVDTRLEIDDATDAGDAPLEIDADDLEIDADDEAPTPVRAAARAEVTEPIVESQAPSDEGGAAFARSPLSKFRRPAEAAPAAAQAQAEVAADAGGSALGRVKIKRVKQAKDGRAPARARVLASY